MTTEERALLDARIFSVETTTRRLLAVDEAEERKERRQIIEAMAMAHGTTPERMFTSFIPAAKG
jgi:hypothetical protein